MFSLFGFYLHLNKTSLFFTTQQARCLVSTFIIDHHVLEVHLNTVNTKHIIKGHTEGILLRSSCIKLFCVTDISDRAHQRERIRRSPHVMNNESLSEVMTETETLASTVFTALLTGCETFSCFNASFTESACHPSFSPASKKLFISERERDPDSACVCVCC